MPTGFTIFTSLRYDPVFTSADRIPPHAGSNASTTSPLYMVDLHRDRLLRAATHFKWTPVINLLSGADGLATFSANVVSGLAEHQRTAAQRVKVTIDGHGTFTIAASAAPTRPLRNMFPARLPPPRKGSDSPAAETTAADDNDPIRAEEDAWTVVVDGQNKVTPSVFTHVKTSRREIYDAARTRAGIGPPDRIEVLVLDQDGRVMEGSMTTPYFWRAGRWVTPPTRGEVEPGEWEGGQDGTTRRWALEREMVVEEHVGVGSLADGEECWVSNGIKGFVWARVKLG